MFVAIFLSRNLFKDGKKEIMLNNNSEVVNDILSDGQPENKSEEVVTEPEKIPEKVEDITKKETSDPTPIETEKESVSGKNAEEKPGQETALNVINKLVSWGFQTATGRNIDTIIIHSSYDAIGNDPFDVDGLIKEYKSYGVSPHYLIDRAGKIYRLVEEKNIAYHAGTSQTPDGRSGVNAFSIGIEMMNIQKGNFTTSQYVSIDRLVGYLKGKYKIKYVLGHDQIAPGRKDDPWNFDWNKLD